MRAAAISAPTFLLCLFGCATSPSAPQNPVEPSRNSALLTSIIDIAKEDSLHSADMDWPTLKAEVWARFDEDEPLGPPIEHLLTELGDFHGFAIIDGQQYRGTVARVRDVGYDFESPEYANGMSTIYQAGQSPTELRTAMLSGAAYVEIPMIENPESEAVSVDHAVRIRKAICALEENEPVAWIVDLRGNLGGNFHPMLAGLGELFPEMDLGGDTRDGKELLSSWTMQGGNLVNAGYSVPGMPPTTCGIELGQRKVAVLVGRFTVSSGEAVASGLRGHANVRVFGERTAGASTTTSWRTISEGAVFNPAIAYFMSADGTVHKDGVEPDVNIPEEYDPEQPLGGEVIRQAVAWATSRTP